MADITGLFFKAGTFPSMAIFFSLRNSLGTTSAALAAAAYSVYYTLAALGAQRVTKLDYGVAIFWVAGLCAVMINGAHGYFGDYFGTGLSLSLFCMALLHVVFDSEPFTTAFARRRTPREFWNTEPFVRINRIMTLCWAGLFLTAALLSLLFSGWRGIMLAAALLLSLGIPFNRKFPEMYLKGKGLSDQGAPPRRNPEKSPEKVESTTAVAEGTAIRRHPREEERSTAGGEPIRKALVIFGSPRGERGYTYQLLKQFLAGMTAGGVTSEIVNLADRKIKPCTGCFSCWTKTPGVCIHDDDMAELIQKVVQADLVVYAQPLYVFSVPGPTKNFLDRLLPHLMPFLGEGEGGLSRHPLRWNENKVKRMCIFSVCGFPEARHFDPMLAMFRAMARNSGAVIVGEMLRPASESLLFKERYKEKYARLEADLFEAGRQVAGEGYVSRELEKRIAEPFIKDMAAFHGLANHFWNAMIEYEEKKKRGENPPPRNEYLLSRPGMVFHGMAAMYNPDKAGAWRGIIQFEVTDREDGAFFLEVLDGRCRCVQGVSPRHDLRIETPWEVWNAISQGHLSGQDAFLRRLYKVQGDMRLLAGMRDAFSG